MTRIPTFRRRFTNLVKVLYLEAIQAAASSQQIGRALKFNLAGKSSVKDANGKDKDETEAQAWHRALDSGILL